MGKYLVTVQFKDKRSGVFRGREYAFWLTMPLPALKKNPLILIDVKGQNKDYQTDVQVTHIFKNHDSYFKYFSEFCSWSPPIIEENISFLTRFHIELQEEDGWNTVHYLDYQDLDTKPFIWYGKDSIALKVFLDTSINSHAQQVEKLIGEDTLSKFDKAFCFTENTFYHILRNRVYSNASYNGIDLTKNASAMSIVERLADHEAFMQSYTTLHSDQKANQSDNSPEIDYSNSGIAQFYNGTTIDLEITKEDVEKLSNALQVPLNEVISTLSPNVEIIVPQEKEDNKMDFSKMLNIDFGKISATSELKPSMYGVAVLGADKRYRAYDKINDRVIDVTGMTFDTDILFKIPVAVSQVFVGDVIINAGNYVTVTTIHKDGTFTVVDPKASEQKIAIPAKNMFGFDFVTKIICPFDSFIQPSNDNPFGMNPMMMLALSEGTEDMSTILALSMMNGNKSEQNMLPLLLLMKKDSKIDPLVAMLLMKQQPVVPSPSISALEKQPVPPAIDDEPFTAPKAPKNIVTATDEDY